jgi:uncharacterized protein (DUF2267 family)
MSNELVKTVAEKAGISEAQAKQAVDTVMSYMKQHLPAPVVAQIEAALNQPGVATTAAKTLKGVGNLLNKK